MVIFGLDPGPTESAFVIYDSLSKQNPLLKFVTASNADVMAHIRTDRADILVIEKVASFGMPVGAEVFETVFWSGRFAESWLQKWRGARVDRITRIQVKVALCHDTRAKDGNIRQAIIDRFGGSKETALGKKASPGPLFGVSSHIWSALAVAMAYVDIQAQPMVNRLETRIAKEPS